jgi:hypothetical protein
VRRFTREWACLTVAIVVVGIGLSAIGLNSQTIWKFDAVILGAFLLGDYPIRWMIRQRRKNNIIVRLLLLEWARPPVPQWSKLAFGFCIFFLIVLIVGDFAWLVSFFTGILYAGKIPTLGIVEISFLLSVWLAVDFRDHYRKDMGVEDDFWENIPA